LHNSKSSLCLVSAIVRKPAEPPRNADVIIPQLAHLIGRRMAREDFTACIVGANGNDKGSEGDDRMDASRKQGWNILHTLIVQPHALIQALSA
jgi:hypothetical protein